MQKKVICCVVMHAFSFAMYGMEENSSKTHTLPKNLFQLSADYSSEAGIAAVASVALKNEKTSLEYSVQIAFEQGRTCEARDTAERAEKRARSAFVEHHLFFNQLSIHDKAKFIQENVGDLTALHALLEELQLSMPKSVIKKRIVRKPKNLRFQENSHLLSNSPTHSPRALHDANSNLPSSAQPSALTIMIPSSPTLQSQILPTSELETYASQTPLSSKSDDESKHNRESEPPKEESEEEKFIKSLYIKPPAPDASWNVRMSYNWRYYLDWYHNNHLLKHIYPEIHGKN